jgi:hypothetical protein
MDETYPVIDKAETTGIHIRQGECISGKGDAYQATGMHIKGDAYQA